MPTVSSHIVLNCFFAVYFCPFGICVCYVVIKRSVCLSILSVYLSVYLCLWPYFDCCESMFLLYLLRWCPGVRKVGKCEYLGTVQSCKVNAHFIAARYDGKIDFRVVQFCLSIVVPSLVFLHCWFFVWNGLRPLNSEGLWGQTFSQHEFGNGS